MADIVKDALFSPLLILKYLSSVRENRNMQNMANNIFKTHHRLEVKEHDNGMLPTTTNL